MLKGQRWNLFQMELGFHLQKETQDFVALLPAIASNSTTPVTSEICLAINPTEVLDMQQ